MCVRIAFNSIIIMAKSHVTLAEMQNLTMLVEEVVVVVDADEDVVAGEGSLAKINHHIQKGASSPVRTVVGIHLFRR